MMFPLPITFLISLFLTTLSIDLATAVQYVQHEILTQTYYPGSTTQFTHTALVAMQTDHARNVRVKVSDNMVEELHDFVKNEGACTDLQKPEKPHIPRDMLEKRNPPIRTQRLPNPDECMTRRVQSIIDQMRPGGRFNGLVTLVRTSNIIAETANLVYQTLDGGIRDAMQNFYLYATQNIDLTWVSSKSPGYE